MTNYLKIPENSVFNTEKKPSPVFILSLPRVALVCVFVCSRKLFTHAHYTCIQLYKAGHAYINSISLAP